MPSATFRPEPPHAHGAPARTAILYCNLGTPEAPTPPAVRKYLAEFLSDPRVVEIPRPVWLPLLYGVILPRRSKASAAKYASIWTPEGSPLMVWTQKQASRLKGWMGERGHRVLVDCAMRYGKPSIPERLDALKAAGATRILILPAYPQYSGTTTASLVDAVGAWASGVRNVPELRFVNRYHDEPAYIEALVTRIRRHWRDEGRGDHLVMSFHGVPERTLHLGDPYHCECQKTARLLAERLGLAAKDWSLTFQSRFGRAKWLEPSTEARLKALARQGVAKVDVVCPGFVADCLETLEEIAIEGRHTFLAAGGKDYAYIPCVNADDGFIAALGGVAQAHLGGWPTAPTVSKEDLDRMRERAVAAGARD